MLLHSKTSAAAITRLARKLSVWIAAGMLFVLGLYGGFQGWPTAAIDSTKRAYDAWPTQVSAWANAPQLPVVNIDVKFKHVEILQAKRRQALEDGILVTSGEDFVPASLRVDGRTIPVKLRLKGDWTDHLRGDKWSLRIKTKGDEQLWGMRTFSLQHPNTRSWDGEWLYHRHLRAEGVLGLRYRFVEARLNGEDLGIFALEEHFSKELLESQRRREGVIIKPDEAGLWERRVTMRKYHSLRFEDLPAMNLVAFGEKTVASSETLTNQATAAIEKFSAVLSGDLEASRAFHVERTAKFLAITEFWSADHALAFHNFRLYYDPLTGLMEPIGFDANPLHHMHYSLLATESEWTKRLLEDPRILAAYREHLAAMVKQDYLKSVFERSHDQWNDVVNTLQREWPDFQPSIWAKVEKRRRILTELLAAPSAPAGWFACHEDGTHYRTAIGMANASTLPVEMRERVKLADETTWQSWGPWRMVEPLTVERVSKSTNTRVDEVEVATREPNGKVLCTGCIEDTSSPSVGPVEEVEVEAFLKWQPEAKAFKFLGSEVVIDDALVVPVGTKVLVGPGTTITISDTGSLACDKLQLDGKPNEPIEMKVGGRLLVRSQFNASHVSFCGLNEHATIRSQGTELRMTDCVVDNLGIEARAIYARGVQFSGAGQWGVKSSEAAEFFECKFEGAFQNSIYGDGGSLLIRASSFSGAKNAILIDRGCRARVEGTLIAKVDTAIKAKRLASAECENVYIHAAKRGLVCGGDIAASIDCVRLQVGSVEHLTEHSVVSRITIDKQSIAPQIKRAN